MANPFAYICTAKASVVLGSGFDSLLDARFAFCLNSADANTNCNTTALTGRICDGDANNEKANPFATICDTATVLGEGYTAIDDVRNEVCSDEARAFNAGCIDEYKNEMVQQTVFDNCSGDNRASATGCEQIVAGTTTVANCIENPVAEGRQGCDAGVFDSYPVAFCATGDNITQIGECGTFDTTRCIRNAFSLSNECIAVRAAAQLARVLPIVKGWAVMPRHKPMVCAISPLPMCVGRAIRWIVMMLIILRLATIHSIKFVARDSHPSGRWLSTQCATADTDCDLDIGTSGLTLGNCIDDPYAVGNEACDTEALSLVQFFYCAEGTRVQDNNCQSVMMKIIIIALKTHLTRLRRVIKQLFQSRNSHLLGVV